jgi:hypothetical protein
LTSVWWREAQHEDERSGIGFKLMPDRSDFDMPLRTAVAKKTLKKGRYILYYCRLWYLIGDFNVFIDFKRYRN